MNIYALLLSENPGVREIELIVFADILTIYFKCKKNIEENGIIVLHPRTGQPMENPYLKIMDDKRKSISRNKTIKCSFVDNYQYSINDN